MADKDDRLYGKLTLEFPHHRKIAPLSDRAFRALVEAILYSREQTTDGLLERRYALFRWGAETLQELCDNDDENPSLTETPKGWIVHDYDEHQDTKAEVEARRERNKAAGRKGGLARAKRVAKRPAKQPASDAPSETQAESVSETETHVPAKAGTTRAQRPQPTFGEMVRGEPDPPQPEPPADRAVRGRVSTPADDLVRDVIAPNRYPAAVMTALRLQVSQLLNSEDPPSLELVREALRLWDERDAGGPALLPHLLADAARSLRPGPAKQPAGARKVAVGLELAARLAATSPDPQPALEAR